ncbi:MAG: hypothetical protein AAB250_05215, partial [Bdellovibrionota bacterium]
PYQLEALAADTTMYRARIKLTSDIDMSCLSGNHTIIGTTANPFQGTFDGNGKAIRNWVYENATTDNVGLFGYSRGGAIHDLKIEDSRVVGKQGVGIALGRGEAAHVLRVSTSGSMTGDTWVGGVVGRGELGAVDSCGSSAKVYGRNDVGGVLGSGGTPLVISSYFTGQVVGAGTNTGGVVGNLGLGYLFNSYSTGAITSTGPNVGGAFGGGGSAIRDSYSSGSVSGTTSVGGLVGTSTGAITNCFTTAMVTGKAGTLTSVGFIRGTLGAGGTMTNSHYWTGTSCDADSDTIGTQACGATAQGTQGAVASFYSVSNEPLASWDFEGESTIGTADHWTARASDYPVAWTINPASVGIPFFIGRGTLDEPYVISTVAEFNLIGSNPRWMGSHFKLGANIDFAGSTLRQIGGWWAPFYGTLDGNSKSMSNFVVNQSSQPFGGVFG